MAVDSSTYCWRWAIENSLKLQATKSGIADRVTFTGKSSASRNEAVHRGDGYRR